MQSFNSRDTLHLREALRGLRFMLRRGGETLLETINFEVLPSPASKIAGAVLREVDGLARSVDEKATGVAKAILVREDRFSRSLHQLIAGPESDIAFATAFYVALTAVIRRIGIPSVFVSEAAVKRSINSISSKTANERTESYAARLSLALIDSRVMRGATTYQGAVVPVEAVEPVCLFAVMLWIQSERSEVENEAILGAAADISIALTSEISAVFLNRNIEGMAALYARCIPHV